MDRNLALEFVRVTEAAALAAVEYMGRGDKIAADQAAVDAMRSRFNDVDFTGTVVIGEGAKDEAPELYVGEELGTGNGDAFDIAVDPLECTDSVANGVPNAIAVIATGPKGSLFHAPDMYMYKIACGPKAVGAIDITKSATENLQSVAKKLGKPVEEMVVVLLDRPRHEPLITELRQAGARVRLISDGDVAGAIAPSIRDSGIDMLINIGASAEAVLAAAAIKCLGGDFQAQFWYHKEEQKEAITALGYGLEDVYTIEDLAAGDHITFTATGIIDGPLLKGIRYVPGYAVTHSVVMRCKSGTVRYLETYHTH